MKIIVFGSRTLTDIRPIRAILTDLHAHRRGGEGFTVIHGGAKGADQLAGEAARGLEWAQTRSYPAEWRVHAEGWCPGPRCSDRGDVGTPMCKSAGPRRNQEMIDREYTRDEPIDLALGFIDKPLRSSRGSHDMFKRVRTAEIELWLLWIPRNTTGAQLGEPRRYVSVSSRGDAT